MKHLLLIIITLNVMPLFSQRTDIILDGIVVIQNSKYKTGKTEYLNGVSIKAEKTMPTESDLEGKFRLIFSDKPLGNIARITAEKTGYEIVNSKEFENTAVIGRIAPLSIVMCKAGSIEQARKEYYEITDREIVAKFEKQKLILLRNNEDSKKLISELQTKLDRQISTNQEAIEILEIELVNLKEKLYEISKEFSIVNLDDKSAEFINIYEAFGRGEIDFVIQSISKSKIIDSLHVRALNLEKRERKINTLKQENEKEEKNLKDELKILKLQGDAYLLNFDYKNAEIVYDSISKYNTKDISLIWDCASFYQTIKKHSKSIALWYKVISSGEYAPFVPDIYEQIGNLYIKLNIPVKSEEAFLKSIEIHKKTEGKYTSGFYNKLLAQYYSSIAGFYLWKKDFSNAKKYFSESIKINENKDKIGFWYSTKALTKDYHNLGILATHQNDYLLADSLFTKCLTLLKQITNRDNEDLLNIASTEGELGNIKKKIGDKGAAKKFLFNSFNLVSKLFSKDSLRYVYDLCIKEINVATLYLDERNIDSGFYYLKKAVCHCENEFLALAYKNIGAGYFWANQMDSAELHFKKSFDVYEKLYKNNQDRYIISIAETYQKMATILGIQKKYTRADSLFFKSKQIVDSLIQVNLDFYEVDYIVICYNMAIFYFNWWNENPHPILRKKALDLVNDVKKRLFKYPKFYDFSITLNKLSENLNTKLNNNFLIPVIVLDALEEIETKEKVLDLEESYEKKVTLSNEIIVLYNDILKKLDTTEINKPSIILLTKRKANIFGNVSWFLIFTRQFKEAEKAAREGLSNDKDAIWINTNLALSLLLQGKFEEAEKIYIKYMSVPDDNNKLFKEIFLEDLKAVEEAKILHKHIEKARKLLSGK